MSTKSSLSKSKQNYPVKNEMEKYQVIKLLGEGSFGRVYKAKVVADSSFVALKVISKGRRSNKELVGLRRECEIQRHLHHPNIIQMIDSFETSSEIVVVTEFAQKELNTILGKEGYLSEERACPIIWDLVSALNYLHSCRVLHRDLKPQNVLLDSKNRAKLCDFGFARNMSTGTHVLTSIKGTPLYMAPELIEEQPYDYKADLWSLGCIMFEMLVGAPPFCSASLLHLFRLIQHEQIEWPTFVSEHCNSFLKGLLQKDPNERIAWDAILNHPFVKGHILICKESNSKPLTRAPSDNTLQAKEKQRKNHIANKHKLLEKSNTKSSKSPHDLSKKSETRESKSNNNSLNKQLQNLTLNNTSEQSTSYSSRKTDDFSQISAEKLGFIEESSPVETEEWIVFLQKSMQEVISGEILSLTQTNLTNIIVSPLRNSNTSPKVFTYVAKLLSLPFVVPEISNNSLEQIKKVYQEVKLVPNLIYACKILMRVKREEKSTESSFEDSFKTSDDLTSEDIEALGSIFMLITHLVHLENDFLMQLCDSIAVLKVFTIFKMFLLLSRINLQIVMDVMAILTHILRVFPDHSDLVDKIVLGEDKSMNFVDFLRHNDPLMRERACFFLLFLGRTLSTNKMGCIWNEDVKDTLEALMYDSIESVRNAADKGVEDLKNKEFYKCIINNKSV